MTSDGSGTGRSPRPTAEELAHYMHRGRALHAEAIRSAVAGLLRSVLGTRRERQAVAKQRPVPC